MIKWIQNWLNTTTITCEHCGRDIKVNRKDYTLIACPNCWQYNRLKKGVKNVSGTGSQR